jgi:hypothetical protein
MTDDKRAAILKAAIDELKITKQGYVVTPRGPHWKSAMGNLNVLLRDLYLSVPVMCYPLPAGVGGSVCQGLHETAGIPGNWAIDFCDVAGTPVVSPEAGTVTHLSGHDPSQASPNPQGIYGWSIYVKTPKGYVYYVTHLGHRAALAVGARVKVGQELGTIGNQQPFTGRPNHTHVGVTSPAGATDARKHMTAVSTSPRSS